VIAVQVAVDGADLRSQHALQRHRGGIDHRHLGAALARRGGELRSDPPGADHDHLAARLETPAQRVAVRERAQVVDRVQVGAGDRQPTRFCARGQQQPVVAELAPVLEPDLGAARVERAHGSAGDQLDVVLTVEGLRMDIGLLARGLRAQVILGQRRALVGSLRLGADQDDPAVEPLLA
jgi:hypothetical protein